jgi:hypothetical protein
MVRTAGVFRGAASAMACVASGEKWLKLAFSEPFSLLHFFWASKRNEEN